jgi:hypothetical protein
MSYDVHWFRPEGESPLLEQARADRPCALPSPEHDARRQAFVEAFAREFPDAVMKPAHGGFPHGCSFVRRDEDGDEDAEAGSDFAFFELDVDGARFSRVIGGSFPGEIHDRIARLLFAHGFVAYDPQTGFVGRDMASLGLGYLGLPDREQLRREGAAIVVKAVVVLVATAAGVAWIVMR